MAMTIVLFVALLKRIAAAFVINTKLSCGLVDGFFHRHPELHKKRVEILEDSRAIFDSQERVDDYFARLKAVVDGVIPAKSGIWMRVALRQCYAPSDAAALHPPLAAS
jgi:hypothetical protein